TDPLDGRTQHANPRRRVRYGRGASAHASGKAPRSARPWATSTPGRKDVAVPKLLVIVTALLLGVASAKPQGRLTLEPMDGVVGTPVSAVATGLTPRTEVELVWLSPGPARNVG